ncbi:hypothetical protein ACFODO_02110 [Acinetobacter sichuanensis]|uniref:Cation efflux protein transmembrane domain-containing protein n=1 Tax=Acinetobacter sichuanensis TaxID=2136183 RepID=A0A371YUQ7_9GAMM|nr:hypothetical protein [Acinetobacter sichuanensis]RFC85205.1 hypothetical protein C9E89_002145 [Acinetobacter sichuanensis]
MNKIYKTSFMLSAVISILYFMINEIHKDNVVIDTGIGIILAIITVLLIFFIWLYLRSEDKRIKQKKESMNM